MSGATEVITWNVTPGREAEFESWAHDLTAVATRQQGHLGAAWLRPSARGGPYHVVIRFSSTELLDRWMGSNERAEWVKRLDGIALPEHDRRTGMEAWFSLPGTSVRPPPRWKMAAITLATIYPISLLFNWLVSPSIKGTALVVRAAIFPSVLVPLLTFVLMPQVSRLFRKWLYGRD